MTTDPALLRRAVLAALGYIAIMAAGMATTGQVFGIQYGDPRMVTVLVVFEVALSLYALAMARRLFGAWQCGFGPIDWRGLAWLAPNFLLVAAMLVAALGGEAAAITPLALLIVVTTALVGFSEELAFRGLALRGALPALGTGRAILLSSALFTALHSVNMLAFLPVEAMLQQLALTFVFGLAMACYALRANSLVPVMVFHALWDMVQFLGVAFEAEVGALIMLGIAVNALVALALWVLVLRRLSRDSGAAPAPPSSRSR